MTARPGETYSVGDYVTGTCYREGTDYAFTEFAAVKPYRDIGLGEDAYWYVYPPPEEGNCDPLKLPHAGVYSVVTTVGSNPPAPEQSHTTVRGKFTVIRLRADAGGPYTAVRGSRVQLDGTKSRPEKEITSYRWTYKLGKGCPADAKVPEGAGSDKSKPEFVALCTVRATLTVGDRDGNEDPDSAQVTVSARRWKTKFSSRMSPPRMNPNNYFVEPVVGKELVAGVNACDNWRAVGIRTASAFCRETEPLSKGAYELKTVRGDNGPFHGWTYTTKGGYPLAAERTIFINPWFPADGRLLHGKTNWYHYNLNGGEDPAPLNRGVDPAPFIQAILAHEGSGSGKSHTGHSQAIKDFVELNDPNRFLERQYGPDEQLDSRIRRCLNRIATGLNDYKKDDLGPGLLKQFVGWGWDGSSWIPDVTWELGHDTGHTNKPEKVDCAHEPETAGTPATRAD